MIFTTFPINNQFSEAIVLVGSGTYFCIMLMETIVIFS